MHLLLAVLLQMPSILMFHRVDTQIPTTRLGRELTVSPLQLRDELAYIADHHLRAVSVDDFLEASRLHEPTQDMVILTFDDGYEDQYSEALPILLQYGARATFFITTGNVGTRNHLTWPQIRTMFREGMSIGGHNVNHVDLAALTRSQQRRQINGCLQALRTHAQIEADTYAYPGGTFNRTTELIMEGEPIELAFTTDRSHALGIDSRFEVARLRIKPETTIAEFSAELIPRSIARVRAPH
jgi:peptidoglycan/xylan/chitin deacetylase (PgdA/CDA1 family)